MGERRSYVVGHSGRNSLEPKMISKAFTKIMRSEPHFNGAVDVIHAESSGQAPKQRPDVHSRTVAGTHEIGIGQSPF